MKAIRSDQSKDAAMRCLRYVLQHDNKFHVWSAMDESGRVKSMIVMADRDGMESLLQLMDDLVELLPKFADGRAN